MTPNPDYIAALKESVLTAPYPALLGMSLDAIEFDRCSIGLTLAEKHLQPFGIIHGGVLATLIDTATFWAGFLRLPDDVGLVNVDLKLNYLKAVSGGTGMMVFSRILETGWMPRLTMSSVKPVNRVTGFRIRRATKCPAPRRVSISPSSANCSRHCRKVERDTPSSSANSRSGGSASPAAIMSSSIAEVSALISRWVRRAKYCAP